MEGTDESFPDGDSLFRISMKILFAISMGIAVSAGLINAMIIIAFLVKKARRPASVSPAGLLVLNLLFADTFVSVCMVSDVIVSQASTTDGIDSYLCSVLVGFMYFTGCGSYTALINVVIDRLIAIRHTLKYREYMTRTRSIVMVCTGWLLPIAGLVGVVAAFDDDNWRPGLGLCIDTYSLKIFVRYVFVPTHIAASLCVVVIQSRIYLILRRQDAETTNDGTIPGTLSNKSGRILYRIIIPMCFFSSSYDVMLIVISVWHNNAVMYLYEMTVLFVQISFALNIFLYSFATACIRDPVCDLFADFRRLIRTMSATSPKTSREGRATGRVSSSPLTVLAQ